MISHKSDGLTATPSIASQLAFAMLAVGVLAIPLSAYRFGANLTIYDIMFAGAFLVFLPSWLLGDRPGATPALLKTALGLVMAGLTLSSVFRSSNAPESLSAVFKLSFVFLLFFLQAPLIANTRAKVVILTLCLSVSGVVAFVGAFIQAKTGAAGGLFGEAVYGRLTGFTEHPNELGIHCVAALFSSVYLIRSALVTGGLAVIVLIAGCLSGAAVLLSASMTAAASVLLGAGVIVFADVRAGKYRSVVYALLIAVVLPASWLFFSEVGGENSLDNRVHSLFDADVEDTTLGSRTLTYEVAWDQIKESPLIGRGSAVADAPAIGDTLVHNVFLRAWYEGGGVAMVGMVALFAVVGYMCMSTNVGDSASRTALFVSLLVGCWFAPILFQRVVWVVVCILYINVLNYRIQR